MALTPFPVVLPEKEMQNHHCPGYDAKRRGNAPSPPNTVWSLLACFFCLGVGKAVSRAPTRVRVTGFYMAASLLSQRSHLPCPDLTPPWTKKSPVTEGIELSQQNLVSQICESRGEGSLPCFAKGIIGSLELEKTSTTLKPSCQPVTTVPTFLSGCAGCSRQDLPRFPILNIRGMGYRGLLSSTVPVWMWGHTRWDSGKWDNRALQAP